MSQVRNVRLAVADQGNDVWRVTVNYEARFTSREESMNLRFIERITLFGQDQVRVQTQNGQITNITTQDEQLLTRRIGVRASARVQQMTRTFDANSEDLDEDDGSQVGTVSIPQLGFFVNPQDEILAQVELIPVGISSGRNRSAVLRENF